MKNIPLLSRAANFFAHAAGRSCIRRLQRLLPYQKAAPSPEPTVPLTGMVTYRERMALPPDAELTVTLHRKTSDGRMLVAEERASTEGRNVPLPFSIACPAADSSSMSYELEAAISSGGTTLFATTVELPIHTTFPPHGASRRCRHYGPDAPGHGRRACDRQPRGNPVETGGAERKTGRSLRQPAGTAPAL